MDTLHQTLTATFIAFSNHLTVFQCICNEVLYAGTPHNIKRAAPNSVLVGNPYLGNNVTPTHCSKI